MPVLVQFVAKIVLMFVGMRNGVFMAHAIVHMDEGVAMGMSMPACKRVGHHQNSANKHHGECKKVAC